jgi:REP element-mobilizing transposase RayT
MVALEIDSPGNPGRGDLQIAHRRQVNNKEVNMNKEKKPLSHSGGRNFSAYQQSPPEKHKGWYRPNRIPHFDTAGIHQLITYRQTDSLPASKRTLLDQELKCVNPAKHDIERRKKIENWLDAGYGSCILRNPQCAKIIVDSWKHGHGKQFNLLAWTVMPNHVHVLIQQHKDHRLSDIVGSWKKFTARKINALNQPSAGILGANGRSGEQPSREGRSLDRPPSKRKTQPLWQKGYWDRFIRNQAHFESAIDYILNNPVKAGLVQTPTEWPWSGSFAD